MSTSDGPLSRGAGRFDVLLVLLVSVLVLAPFERAALRPVIVALLSSVFMFALWTSNALHSLFATFAAVTAVCVIVAGAVQAARGASPRAVFAGVSVALCIASIAAIVARLTPPSAVTARTLSGTLAVYLLSGLAFAYSYSMIGALRAAGFFAQTGPHGPVAYLYFSFSTLTTVGFGDLTAGSDAGRMLTVVEALFGQLYLVTVVAVVVSNRRRAP